MVNYNNPKIYWGKRYGKKIKGKKVSHGAYMYYTHRKAGATSEFDRAHNKRAYNELKRASVYKKKKRR